MTEQNDLDNFDYPEQGSFIAGFSLGLFAGAAAYFLFGTERGGKIRKELVQEWDKAKKTMVADGAISDVQISLREFLQTLAQDIFNSSLPTEIISPTRSRRGSARSAAARKAKRGSAKFSGV